MSQTIQSQYGGGTQITTSSNIVSPTGEELRLNDTGDGVLCWYTDPYDSVRKCMAISLANQRQKCEWMASPSNNLDITGLTNLASGYDPYTAKHNTDVIEAFVDDLAIIPDNAAGRAREAHIAGVACSLPNKQQLEIIWKVRNIVDSLDTTASANPTKKLSNWGFDVNDNWYCWSSSEHNNGSAWCISSSNVAYYANKYDFYGVIPILELNPTTLQPI